MDTSSLVSIAPGLASAAFGDHHQGMNSPSALAQKNWQGLEAGDTQILKRYQPAYY